MNIDHDEEGEQRGLVRLKLEEATLGIAFIKLS
jgi:hypothetical protein